MKPLATLRRRRTGQISTGRGVRRRHRYDDRMPHRGVLQNRDGQRDRRLLPAADGDEPCLKVIVSTHITYHLAKRAQPGNDGLGSREREKGLHLTGVEEPGLRPNAAAAEAPMEPAVRTSAVWSR